MNGFPVKQAVRRKDDGALGLVTESSEREIVVRFAPTGAIRNSPWGPSVDSKGDTGHYVPKYAERMIEAI